MDFGVQHLLILGCGYVGEKLARACIGQGMRVSATTRDKMRAEKLREMGIHAQVVASPEALPESLLASVDAVLDSIPLTRDASGMHASQPIWLPELTVKLSGLKWAAYLSTTGVYGDAGGAWVDETFPCKPASERGIQRLVAENAWLNSGLPAEIFRLAGIYGPDRNIIARLKAGGYKAVQWNPPHYSSRIHVDDIVTSLIAAMKMPRAGRMMNLADDDPCPHSEYVTEMAALLGAPKPELLTPEEGEKELSAAMLDFFRDNKRVSNQLLHKELLPELKYPSFRDALPELV